MINRIIYAIIFVSNKFGYIASKKVQKEMSNSKIQSIIPTF